MRYKQIAIDPELHQQVKAAAALEGKSIGQFTEEALREYLPLEQLLPFSPSYLVDERERYEEAS